MYENKSEEYFGRGRSEVLDLLPRDFNSVIDIGGATGATLNLIRAQFPRVSTMCADSHEPSLQIAARNGHVAIKCDLDREIPEQIAACDVVLCLDVLEHLIDPWRTLSQIRQAMNPRRVIIVSLPNVRFFPVSAALFFCGKWELQDAGVLDRTHLRFFTRDSAIEMVEKAGFRIIKTQGNIGMGRRGAIANLLTLGLLRDLLSVQFLLVGMK